MHTSTVWVAAQVGFACRCRDTAFMFVPVWPELQQYRLCARVPHCIAVQKGPYLDSYVSRCIWPCNTNSNRMGLPENLLLCHLYEFRSRMSTTRGDDARQWMCSLRPKMTNATRSAGASREGWSYMFACWCLVHDNLRGQSFAFVALWHSEGCAW